jgi:hypothetical protein
LPGSRDAAVDISIGESSSLPRLVTTLKGPRGRELAADLSTGAGIVVSVPDEDVVPLVPAVGVDPVRERGFNACNKEPILDKPPREGGILESDLGSPTIGAVGGLVSIGLGEIGTVDLNSIRSHLGHFKNKTPSS